MRLLAPVPPGVSKCAKRWSLVALLLAIALPCSGDDVIEIAPECGSRAELEQAVAELTGGHGGARGAHGEKLDVRIARDGEGYLLEVGLPNEGPRSLRDHDCKALFRAAVLIAAIGRDAAIGEVVRSEGEREAHAETRWAEELAKPAAGARTSTRTSPTSVAGSGERWGDIGVEAALVHGLVPGFTLGVGAAAGLGWGRLGGRLGVQYLVPRSHHDGDEGVRAGALGISGTFEVAALRWLRVGLGGDFYALHGRGLGLSTARSDWATLGALHAALAARLFERGRWRLGALARGLFAPQPASFVIHGRSPVYTTSSWGFQLGLGVGWRFL